MPQNQDFLSLIQVALNVSAPIFLVITLGIWLNHKKFINENFIQVSSKLIFNFGLPLMLFMSTATRDFQQLINVQHIALLVITTFVIFFLSTFTAKGAIEAKADKGVFVQGAFRGNLIIIGLALAANAYGEKGVAIATLPMAIVIILYNLLTIYTLNASLGQQSFSLKKTIIDIVKNPLIIGIVAGLCVNIISLPIPDMIIQTNNYLAKMTLPLALICIGGSLNMLQLKDNLRPAVISSIWKLLISPIVLIVLLIIWPVDPIAAGVLFLLVASPTATASFVMVKAMNGNSDLAAKIIIVSTLLSLFTITLGFALLVSLGLIHS
ncbi:AEC family transporter [Pseudocolwellia sp. AS88]|uniref:AEC family transporter n=1 Tax=Pseudocolwellia sp. AS88 TaxID=3063958 RepID=UPI0026EF7CF4|nr:AEC family transporter [Pseudocolwellia sp. AS88]MDO7083490.1 AEC family transporter [Pseudocolwellia sp. AS88]